ncbi:hypothetical protein CL622_04370 [archaeon]|nr:hypothetical protein [archaeon]
MVKLGRMYQHNKTKSEYLIQNIGKMKTEGEWVQSVSYMNNTGDMYTRSMCDFNENFTLIIE